MGGNFKSRSGTKTPDKRLERSHSRLADQLSELKKSSEAISKGRAPKKHWKIVASVSEYLQRSAVRHEEDEEKSVFPHLSKTPHMRPLLNKLKKEHRTQRKLVDELKALVANAGKPRAATRLVQTTTKLYNNYLEHIEREDRLLLPAIKHLSTKIRKDISDEMAKRRGK